MADFNKKTVIDNSTRGINCKSRIFQTYQMISAFPHPHPTPQAAQAWMAARLSLTPLRSLTLSPTPLHAPPRPSPPPRP